MLWVLIRSTSYVFVEKYEKYQYYLAEKKHFIKSYGRIPRSTTITEPSYKVQQKDHNT